MSRCIVTGGAGFIGSHVADILISNGHEVLVIDNLSTGKKENVNSEANFIEHDIRDNDLWANLTNFDYVFHLASLARIQPSIDDPVTANDVNLNGTLQVLEYCRNNRTKLIFSSSSSIYATKDSAMNEQSPKKPQSPYALQKFICEQYINLYRQLYGLEATILRYFNVYGERQILDGAYAAVIGIFLKQRMGGQPLTITGKGKQRRDFTYVKDVARANLMAMGWDGTFNIGTAKNYSINDIANMVGGEKIYLPKRRGEAQSTLANNTRALNAGWQPTKDIKGWVHEAINR